jgi:hypothetical protein
VTSTTPAIEPTDDDDGPSLVRAYVLVHEHHTEQALTTPHVGTLHSGEARP